MKAKLVKESINDNYFLEEIRDAILAGDVYKEAPSQYDPDALAVYIPFLSRDDKVFYYTLLGRTDVYGIEAIDSNGTISQAGADLASGSLEDEDIMQEIQYEFPKPPSYMRPIGEAHSLEEFIEWFQRYGADEDEY